MRVLVIGGGISGEREVSLRSAQSVYEAIGDQHQKTMYDWDGSVEWLKEHESDFDVALPILHGEGGEDGQIQSILEDIGLAYLGSNVEVSRICIDKEKTQQTLREAGIKVPKQEIVTAKQYSASPLSDIPHVLKPINGGSSLDTFVELEGKIDSEALTDVYSRYDRMVLEEYIAGVEVTVPVLDGYDLPLIKIVPPDEFFNFNNKYDGSTQEICNPEDIPEATQKQARELSKRCHEILGCRHLSRVDIIITPDNQQYVLEVNTIPGLTNTSLFPKAAAHVGLPMPELVEYFIQLAANTR